MQDSDLDRAQRVPFGRCLISLESGQGHRSQRERRIGPQESARMESSGRTAGQDGPAAPRHRTKGTGRRRAIRAIAGRRLARVGRDHTRDSEPGGRLAESHSRRTKNPLGLLGPRCPNRRGANPRDEESQHQDRHRHASYGPAYAKALHPRGSLPQREADLIQHERIHLFRHSRGERIQRGR